MRGKERTGPRSTSRLSGYLSQNTKKGKKELQKRKAREEGDSFR